MKSLISVSGCGNFGKKKRLSQQQLADWLGLTRSSISNYENNTQTPPADTLVRLADIYGVSVDYLLGVKNDRKRVLVIEGLTPSQEKPLLEILAKEFRRPTATRLNVDRGMPVRWAFRRERERRPTFLLWAFLDGLRIL